MFSSLMLNFVGIPSSCLRPCHPCDFVAQSYELRATRHVAPAASWKSIWCSEISCKIYKKTRIWRF